VKIEHVFYAGDEGGIVCGLAFPGAGSQVVVISLTHVRIAATHPLADAIRDYSCRRAYESPGVSEHAILARA
jgi:hypothetical protein